MSESDVIRLPYIVYEGTIFLRKLKGGYEFVDSYFGKWDLRRDLPDTDYIDSLLKRRKFKGKKTRFCLVPQKPSFEGERLDEYEALPGWGIIASNLWGQVWDEDTVKGILDQERVEAIVWVDEETGDVDYVTRQAPSKAIETVYDGEVLPLPDA